MIKKNFSKVKWNDYVLIKQYFSCLGVISTLITIMSFCIDVTVPTKVILPLFLLLLFGIYICMWHKANNKKTVHLKINQTNVNILIGDILKIEEDAVNVIAANEYFDTFIDNRIVSENSLHGKFLKLKENSISELDKVISEDSTLNSEENIVEEKQVREKGQSRKYKLGSVVEFEGFILSAFTRLDTDNKSYVTGEDYLSYWMHFWNNIDKIFSGRSINIPLVGAGLTRFQNGKPTKQQLLETMLWTLKISGFHCTYTNRSINFIIHEVDVDEIDFYHIQYNANFN